VTDPTADQTYRLPNNAAATYELFYSTASTTIDAANAVWGVSNGVRFEGATGGADAVETTLSVVDPTVGDATISIPNNAGVSTAMLTSTLTTNAVDVANSIWGVSAGLNFEGTAADGFETFLTVSNATSDRTVTIPDITGNILLDATNAGVASGVNGTNGGDWEPSIGVGGTATTGTGGIGGDYAMTAGIGGAASGAAGIGGTGGGYVLKLGDGGASTDVASGVGGAGGAIEFSTGIGGASTAADGGAGGAILITTGAAGASGAGGANGGAFTLNTGVGTGTGVQGSILMNGLNLDVTETSLSIHSTTASTTDDTLALTVTTGGAGTFTGTIGAVDLTADRSYLLPDAGGTFAVSASGNMALSAAGDVTISASPSFTSLSTTGAVSVSPGGVNDDTVRVLVAAGGAAPFIGTIGAADLTAARAYNLPDAPGTFAVSASSPATLSAAGDIGIAADGIDATHLADALSPEAGSTIVGADTIGADPAFANNAIGFGTTGLIFEGATGAANTFETLITVTDPTADRTLTLPDDSGTVALLNGVSASSAFATLVATNGGLIQDYSTGIRADAFSAAGLNVIRCEATTADLATITAGVLGQVITLVFDDAVVLTDTAYGGAANTLALSAAYTSTAGSTITFVFDGNQWTEVARSIQ